MDSITHALLGAVTSQLGFRQRIGRDATLVAAGSAVVADLDILITPLLTLTGTEEPGFSIMANHRGITHSMLITPIMAAGVAGVWWWFKRSMIERRNGLNSEGGESVSAARFGLLYVCVLIAMLSHPLLDIFTSYGTQILLPLSHRRFAFDAVPIVDIIYTPILILTLVVCYVFRKTKKESCKSTLIVGWLGFIFSTAYIGAGLGVHDYILFRLARPVNGEIDRSDPLERCEIHAYPQLGTIFVWRVVSRCRHEWKVGMVNILFGVDSGKLRWNKTEVVDNDWIERAKSIPEVKLFDWFTMGQMRAAYVHKNGRHLVDLYDMRYGIRPDSLESLWTVRVDFDSLGQVWGVEYVQQHRRGKLNELVCQSWQDIWKPQE